MTLIVSGQNLFGAVLAYFAKPNISVPVAMARSRARRYAKHNKYSMHKSYRYVLGSVFERRTDGNPRTLYHKAL
jgi:hypothetical protein